MNKSEMIENAQAVILSVTSAYDRGKITESGNKSGPGAGIIFPDIDEYSKCAPILEVPIQAGTVLTDIRVGILHDNDGDDDNISALNRRFSELTAMFWAYAHLSNPYIGICHYRRKFDISDKELQGLMADKVDTIILGKVETGMPVSEMYATHHYGYDWKVILEILKKTQPDFYGFILNADHTELHPACMAIYKREYFTEVCEMLFPVLFTFVERRPEKEDIYQRRDAGFIAERLLSLYFEYRKKDLKYAEVPMLFLGKKDNENTVNKQESPKLLEEIEELFAKKQFTKGCELALKANCTSGEIDTLRKIAIVFNAERKNEPQTIFDYYDDASNIEKLLAFYSQKKNEITGLINKGLTESTLSEYIKTCGISQTAILKIMEL